MRKFFKSAMRKSNTRSQNKRHDYGLLEDRRLLATTGFLNSVTGHLTVNLTEPQDTAVIDVQQGHVTLNDNEIITLSPWVLANITAANVRSIEINGATTGLFQSVVFNGDFSNEAGADLQSISVSDVNMITFNGNYELAGDLEATMDGYQGQITDSATGRLVVGGLTHINARNNDIILNNDQNDFIGAVSLRAGHFVAAEKSLDGRGFSIRIADANDIEFATAWTGADLTVKAVGDITDTDDSVINVYDLARLTAANVYLGNNASGTTNIGRVTINAPGHVELFEDSQVVFINWSKMGSLEVDSPVGIYDGLRSVIVVSGRATLRGDGGIRLGDSPGGVFNAGELNFNSSNDVYISENNATRLVGDNTANRLELESTGVITDADDAVINVVTLSRFEAVVVTIGDSDTDEFNSGWIRFNTTGRTFIYENSSTHIASLNTAERMVIVSMGEITNAREAIIEVYASTSFAGDKITIGNKSGDRLVFGGLLLNSPGAATVFEDDNTVFISSSSVDLLRMHSLGGITDGLEASLNVSRVASFHTESAGITLGDSLTDEFNANALIVNAPKSVVSITEDSGMILTRANSARSLILSAAGNITDTAIATLEVDYVLDVTGNNIRLDNGLNFRALHFNSTGNTRISTQKTMTLVGDNSAGGLLELESAGNIYDAMDAQTTADQAFLTAVDIVLGDSAFDCFDILPANLVVNASGWGNVTPGC